MDCTNRDAKTKEMQVAIGEALMKLGIAPDNVCVEHQDEENVDLGYVS